MALSNGTAHDRYALPCGRSVEALDEHLHAGGLDEHEQQCPHCRTAAASLRALAAATDALLAEHLEPPAGLREKIMAAVRAEARRGPRAALATPPDQPDLGPLDISAQAVGTIVRYAIDGLDGVRARTCRVVPDADNPSITRIAVSVSLRYGTGPATAVVDAIREQIRAAAGDRIGVRSGRIDIEIADLWGDQQ